MLYPRQRYDNHVDVQEVMRSCQVMELFFILFLTIQLRQSIDPKLPEGWRVKNINGVEYFKVVVSELDLRFAASIIHPPQDEEGPHVFNTRRMVVTYLR